MTSAAKLKTVSKTIDYTSMRIGAYTGGHYHHAPGSCCLSGYCMWDNAHPPAEHAPRVMTHSHRIVTWTLLAVLATMLGYFSLRGYFSPELLLHFANIFHC